MEEINEELINYLYKTEKAQILKILEKESIRNFYDIKINFFDLFYNFPNFSPFLEKYEKFSKFIISHIKKVQEKIFLEKKNLLKKKYFFLRPKNLISDPKIFSKDEKFTKKIIGNFLVLKIKILDKKKITYMEKVEILKCEECDTEHEDFSSENPTLICNENLSQKNKKNENEEKISKYQKFLLKKKKKEKSKNFEDEKICKNTILKKMPQKSIFVEFHQFNFILKIPQVKFFKGIFEGKFNKKKKNLEIGDEILIYGYFDINFKNFTTKSRGNNTLYFHTVNFSKIFPQFKIPKKINKNFFHLKKKKNFFDIYLRNFLIENCFDFENFSDLKILLMLFYIINNKETDEKLNILIF